MAELENEVTENSGIVMERLRNADIKMAAAMATSYERSSNMYENYRHNVIENRESMKTNLKKSKMWILRHLRRGL